MENRELLKSIKEIMDAYHMEMMTKLDAHRLSKEHSFSFSKLMLKL
jgi:hypothetical protein